MRQDNNEVKTVYLATSSPHGLCNKRLPLEFVVEWLICDEDESHVYVSELDSKYDDSDIRDDEGRMRLYKKSRHDNFSIHDTREGAECAVLEMLHREREREMSWAYMAEAKIAIANKMHDGMDVSDEDIEKTHLRFYCREQNAREASQ